MAVQTGCLGALHGEQSLTALNRCGVLVFNKNIIWNVLKVMFIAFSPFVVYQNM